MLARKSRIPVNCADIPDLCDFYFMAQFRQEQFQFAVSTNGGGPRLGARIRSEIVGSLSDDIPKAVTLVGKLREKIRATSRKVYPDSVETIQSRMGWVSRFCDSWSWKQLCALDDESLQTEVIDSFRLNQNIPPPPVLDETVVANASLPAALTSVWWCPSNMGYKDWMKMTVTYAVSVAIQMTHLLLLHARLLVGFRDKVVDHLINRLKNKPVAKDDNISETLVLPTDVNLNCEDLENDSPLKSPDGNVDPFTTNEKETSTNLKMPETVEVQVQTEIFRSDVASQFNPITCTDQESQSHLTDFMNQESQSSPTNVTDKGSQSCPTNVTDKESQSIPVIFTDVESQSRVPSSPTKTQNGSEVEKVPQPVEYELPTLAASKFNFAPMIEDLFGVDGFHNEASSLETESYFTVDEETALGKVYLVGAGPGNPEMLTLQAFKLLQTADLVVSDRLIPQEILNLIEPSKLVLSSFKVGGASDKSQDESNQICLNAALNGQKVVRLKTGDPFVFGRGGEEVLFYRQHQIEAIVIPGLSSVFAGATVANIPVTHREVSDQVLLISGRGKGGSFPHIPSFYAGRTTIILMSLSRLGALSELMIEKGYPLDLPCAVIEKGTWIVGENVCFGTLDAIDLQAKAYGIQNPAMLVVGDVVSVLNSNI